METEEEFLERHIQKQKASEAASLFLFQGLTIEGACQMVVIDRQTVEAYLAKDCRGLRLDEHLPTLENVYRAAAAIRPHDRQPVFTKLVARVGEPKTYGFDSRSPFPVLRD